MVAQLERFVSSPRAYYLPQKRVTLPSEESLRRLSSRASRLYEQKGDINRLWLYVSRWTRYLWGGLSAMVSHAGGIKRYFVFVLNQLQIKGMSLNALNPTVQLTAGFELRGFIKYFW